MNQALNVHRDPSACKGEILCVYFSRLAFSSVVDHRKLISRYVQTSEICFNSLLNLREFMIADLSATELNANPDLLHDPASWSSCLLPKQSSLLPKQSSLLLNIFRKISPHNLMGRGVCTLGIRRGGRRSRGRGTTLPASGPTPRCSR